MKGLRLEEGHQEEEGSTEGQWEEDVMTVLNIWIRLSEWSLSIHIINTYDKWKRLPLLLHERMTSTLSL